MTDCKYWKENWGPSFAGRCSAPDDVSTNATNKYCMSPQTCPYLLEPLYKKKSQMTEIEKVKSEIKVLEKKLAFLEELEKTKSPVEEAFKDWWGEYPGYENWTSDATRWQGFQAGYEFAFAISTAKEVMEKVQKPKTLYQMMYDEKWCKSGCDEFCEIVEKWISQYGCDYNDRYAEGYEDALKILKENLK